VVFALTFEAELCLARALRLSGDSGCPVSLSRLIEEEEGSSGGLVGMDVGRLFFA
jgi:hypothetical protein